MTGISQYYDFSDKANPQQAAQWKETVNSIHSGLLFQPDDENAAGGQLLYSGANHFQIVHFSGAAGTYTREQQQTQYEDTDYYCFLTPLSGKMHLSIPSQQYSISCGRFFLGDFSQPSKLHIDSAVSGLMLKLPKKCFDADLPGTNDICGRLFAGNSGAACVALDYLASISRHASEMSAEEYLFNCQQLTHLFSLSLDGMVDLQSAETTTQNVLLRRMKQYIRAQIANPELSATVIAQAFRITPRYVQMLFKNIDITVRDYIKDLRLEYSRNLLESPLQKSRSITEIAFDVGYSSSAHFSTAFKEKYAISPRDARPQK